MHAKLSLTSAYPKLGHSLNKNMFFMNMTIKLSQLMLNLYVVSRSGSFLRHAMLSLCEYYDLYA